MCYDVPVSPQIDISPTRLYTESNTTEKGLDLMPGYKCPFCGQIMSICDETATIYRCNFDYSKLSAETTLPHLVICITQCPNDDCRKETVFVEGVNGYIENSYVGIYPSSIFRRFPEYVPLSIRNDYEEACCIVDKSPKAAATLSRRCLQGMIHDFWNIHEKNLNAEITQLKGRVSASQWKAIDAVRSIGNIGAHMEHDVSLIVDVEPEEARKLLRLIEHLIEKWYINRHEEELLYSDLAELSKEKTTARNR